MNRKNDNSPAGNTASPSQVPPLIFADVNSAALQVLSLQQMQGLAEAIHTLSDVCCGLLAQPKFDADDGFNSPGQQMEKILELLIDCHDAIINEARLRIVDGRKDVRAFEARAGLILEAALRAGEDLNELAFLASVEARNLRMACVEERAA